MIAARGDVVKTTFNFESEEACHSGSLRLPADLSAEPNGDYGAYALGISGYSDVLTSFRGGDGQLAIHGGAWESMLGTDVSNGCVRLLNETILQIAAIVPLGTPVTIEA